mmetsp:Transcript_77688/g.218035  ORF Transcript_77688/g.218035 Transcript_77688/m.218035 type:complete len:497 (-) Transcript_77688:118-1608(-)
MAGASVAATEVGGPMGRCTSTGRRREAPEEGERRRSNAAAVSPTTFGLRLLCLGACVALCLMHRSGGGGAVEVGDRGGAPLELDADPGGIVAPQAATGFSEALPSGWPTEPAAYYWWALILYMFYIMSVVCDDHLVPTVDAICGHFHIPEDVAGATLVAFACNGPELLTNVCGIFVTKTSVGMGTIVGSAIFNVLCITGACPLVAPKGALGICKKFFLRDVAFSAISILLLWWVLPVVDLLRASVLFGMSVVYAIFVYKSVAWLGPEEITGSPVAEHLLGPGSVGLGHPEEPVECGSAGGSSVQRAVNLLDAMLRPTLFIVGKTVPDISQDRLGKAPVPGWRYVLRMAAAFLTSMAWLSSTAYVVCIGSDQINKYWGIPQSFLGLTLVAVGTSWPNLMASVITAREGRGAIAVSNALGSNVQNVFLVLAGPLWVSVLLNGDYVADGADILSSVVWMGLSLAVTAGTVALDGFRLRSWAGYVLIAFYFVYLFQATFA